MHHKYVFLFELLLSLNQRYKNLSWWQWFQVSVSPWCPERCLYKDLSLPLKSNGSSLTRCPCVFSDWSVRGHGSLSPHSSWANSPDLSVTPTTTRRSDSYYTWLSAHEAGARSVNTGRTWARAWWLIIKKMHILQEALTHWWLVTSTIVIVSLFQRELNKNRTCPNSFTCSDDHILVSSFSGLSGPAAEVFIDTFVWHVLGCFETNLSKQLIIPLWNIRTTLVRVHGG